MQVKKTHRCFSGTLSFCEHDSEVTKTKMNFSKFVPDGPVKGAIIWLSGLTCSEENFMAKAGAFSHLCAAGLAVYCPDTSPRGLDLPKEREHWDFGLAAGFYVDALTDGYRDHYRMYSYVSEEFYAVVRREHSKIAISGHSMGGHGALVIGLRNPEKFASVSAFAPIVNPTQCPWGVKAFTGYLGPDQKLWKDYDSCELIASGAHHPHKILVDQGSSDAFLQEQLLASRLPEVARATEQKIELRLRDGYDHSYYFISSFIAEHIRFHAQRLSTAKSD